MTGQQPQQPQQQQLPSQTVKQMGLCQARTAIAVTFPQFRCKSCTEVKQRKEDLESHQLSVHGMLKQAHTPAGQPSPVLPVPSAPPPPMDGLFPCDYYMDVKSK